MNHALRLAVALALAAGPAAATASGNPIAGKATFQQRCALCHVNSAGARAVTAPNLFGLAGRKAGSSGFAKYSRALKGATVTWDSGSLDTFLQGPGKLVPGTRMTETVRDPQKRADLVAYLMALKP